MFQINYGTYNFSFLNTYLTQKSYYYLVSVKEISKKLYLYFI